MDKTSGQKGAGQHLYPAIDPFKAEMLDVGEGHSLYVEQSGNPDGIPVVVLHGGPGGGCSPYMRRYFDPAHYRIVLFDQRGCGRSRPHASVEANTTWHLVRDIETIRRHLGVDQWHVFGGSWGATLSLIYGQEHPDRLLSLILRGVFLMTQPELDWFYAGGAGKFWPEHWEQFERMIPVAERSNMIAAYHKRLFYGTVHEQAPFARAWLAWENALASMDEGRGHMSPPLDYARAFARLENHYFMHRGWLDDSTAILNRMDRIKQVPGHIVQGRHDMICPPLSAYRVAEDWPNARLHMIHNAGHALSEPGISKKLVAVMDDLVG